MNVQVSDHGPFHRFSFVDESDKLHAYHLFESTRGWVLIDSGKQSTPHRELSEALDLLDISLESLAMVLFTHADADHIGGNRALRNLQPDLLFVAHRADVPFIESKSYIMDHRYGQFESYGVRYDEETRRLIAGMIETDEPVDLHLQGGESIRTSEGLLRVIHLPGHSSGHLGVYDPEKGILVGGDAVYPEGAFTVDGDPIQPPPYQNLQAYRSTIGRIEALAPDRLLLSHFDPLRGDEVGVFLQRSRDWIKRFHWFFVETLHGETVTVPEVIDRYVKQFGNVGLREDLAYPAVSHLRYCRDSHVYELNETRREGLPAYRLTTVTDRNHDPILG